MGPPDRKTHTPGGREHAEGLEPGSGGIWAEAGPRPDLGCGALQALHRGRDDVGGQDAAEDVEVQEIGFISVGGEEVPVSGPGQV